MNTDTVDFSNSEDHDDIYPEPNLAGYMDLEIAITDFHTRHGLFDKNHVYRNFSTPRGLALIINNIEFKSESKERDIRKGTEFDEYNIRQLFTKLGYNVRETKENLGGQEMIDVAKEFAADEGHASCDSCVVVVLSHGNNNLLGGTDGKSIKVDKFIACFNAVEAPLLKGKPKLFFLQACRGKMHDYGTSVDDSTEPAAGNLLQSFENIKIEKQPINGDMFVAYPTVPNYVAKRNPSLGSWFIQSVCEIFSEYAAKEDICSLLTKVNNRVAGVYESQMNEKQMPQFCSSLRKKFYFFPGNDILFTAYHAPGEVASKRTMETEASVKKDGEVLCKTVLTANHYIWGFRGAVQIQAYNKNNEMIWKCGWRIFGVNWQDTSTRNWSDNIPVDVLSHVDELVIVHKHHYETEKE